jgi:hypothetical protein
LFPLEIVGVVKLDGDDVFEGFCSSSSDACSCGGRRRSGRRFSHGLGSRKKSSKIPYYSFTIVGDEDLREKEREKERESVTDFVTEFVID